MSPHLRMESANKRMVQIHKIDHFNNADGLVRLSAPAGHLMHTSSSPS